MTYEEMQALDSIRNDEREGDRERAFRKDEDNWEDTESEPIVQKMMGEDFETFFDVDEDKTLERDNNYLTDAKMGN